MLLKNHYSLANTLFLDAQTLLQRMELSDLSEHVEKQLQELNERKTPTIMFYGLYNAGKSTLINALCRKEIAKVGDVPTTASVQEVPWQGYTLIDTPGINAHEDHTQIADAAVDRSDLILFVMDNMDGFEREIVYEVIAKILQKGKAVAIVLNQKDVKEDEDANIAVPALPSMQALEQKIGENLRLQCKRCGIDLFSINKMFLGIFSLNAEQAIMASALEDRRAGELLYRNSGVETLVNAMDESIRKTASVYMLRTPLIALREQLSIALDRCRSTDIYGEMTSLAKERDTLQDSMRRTQDRLLDEGLRKIDACFENIQNCAISGQPFDGMIEQLNRDLSALVQEVTEREAMILTTQLQSFQTTDAASKADEGGSTLQVSDVIGLHVLIDGLPVPPDWKIIAKVVTVVVVLLDKLFGGKETSDPEGEKEAQRLAAYYKWLNDLRDKKVQAQSTYTETVKDFVRNFYEPKLSEMETRLSSGDAQCAAYSAFAHDAQNLAVRISDELSELALAL